MSITLKRAVVAIGLALVAAPATAHASAIDLGTAAPFVVLAGSTATNTGPSVLGGDLGVSPGTALPGFGTAVIGGATHAADAVALKAQADLTNAYNVAAGQLPVTDLTGKDLGGMTLKPGAYKFSSSAQLTNQLTLDGEGDPAAQFVFEIGSTLITAPASSITLINGASACHIFWQVASSATIDTGTAFQGNVMALTSISMKTGATATGRMLARNGAVTLDTNVLSLPNCSGGSTTTTTTPVVDVPLVAPLAGSPSTPPTTGAPAPAPSPLVALIPAVPAPKDVYAAPPAAPAPRNSPATPKLAVPVPRARVVVHGGSATLVSAPRGDCTDGFRATVRGRQIKGVVFGIDGRRLSAVSRSPFQVYVRAAPGAHKVSARVSFKDGRRARTMMLRYRACAAAVLRPRPGPAVFTG